MWNLEVLLPTVYTQPTHQPKHGLYDGTPAHLAGLRSLHVSYDFMPNLPFPKHATLTSVPFFDHAVPSP